MEETKIQVYGYRWVVLLVFALLNAVVQMHWIAFAPITGEAATFYGVTPLEIGFLSMSFMIVYLLVCFPASYVIERYGLAVGVGIGASLTGIFGLLKGLYASNYTLVCVSQIGLAVAQPFVLNAITQVGANWFPIQERATAAGLAVLAQYLGIVIAMVATPYLVLAYSIHGMLLTYGIVAFVTAALFVALMRSAPPTPPCPPGHEVRMSISEGLGRIFRSRDMVFLILVFFFGLGMFNAITTWIEQILAPRGINITQAGMIGGIMMIGGIIGATILPIISDKVRRRVPFLILTTVCTAPGLLGLTFARSYALLLASGFVMGFFFMSAGPLGFQYGAEVSYPAPESVAQGLLMLSGQISGILFIFGMDKFRSAATGSMTPSMIVFLGLGLLNIILCTRLRESTLIQSEKTL
jgi:cyanate permease